MSEAKPAASLSSLKPDELNVAFVNGMQVVLYVVDGQTYCTEDICSHEECFLSEGGWMEGTDVVCSCHDSHFDIRTGEVKNPPADAPIRTFPTRVEGDNVFVDVG